MIFSGHAAARSVSAAPAHCGKLRPRLELRCARTELRNAHRHAPPHSRAYWRWRAKIDHRWISQAFFRIDLALAHVPNYGAASYWTHRYFGHGSNARLMLCFAHRESRYELAATHQNYPIYLGVDHGPWQVNDVAHRWVNFKRLVRSWKYAAAVAYRLATYVDSSGTVHFDFAPWGGSC